MLIRLRRRLKSRTTSRPSTRATPDVGSSSVTWILMSVVLPAPFGPSTPNSSPWPLVQGTFGVVSSTHWLATQCAMSVLERGGNAFDAAVAAGFVLQVVEPHLNGLGGEVPIILWDSTVREVQVICGQGPAPQAATIEQIRSMGLEDIPGSG